VDKKGTNKKRMVLDMSCLNKFILCPKFKMTTAKGVRQVTLDLKSAYWQVPIHPKFQPLLGFKIEDQAYQFRAMPFCLNIALRVFTNLCAVIIKELRIKGIKIFAYLDDWIVWAPSFKLCIQALETVCKAIQKYGFIVNQEKSIFIPTQVIQWLGADLGHQETNSLPLEFQKKVRDSIMRFLKCKLIICRHLERIVELINFTCVASPLGRIYLKRVNRYLREVARFCLRDIPVPLSPKLKAKLLF